MEQKTGNLYAKRHLRVNESGCSFMKRGADPLPSPLFASPQQHECDNTAAAAAAPAEIWSAALPDCITQPLADVRSNGRRDRQTERRMHTQMTFRTACKISATTMDIRLGLIFEERIYPCCLLTNNTIQLKDLGFFFLIIN